MKSETKSERRTLQAKDAAGQLHQIIEITVLRRFGYADGTWSEWTRVSGQYLRGTEPVNLEDDGSMTAVATGDKLTPLAPL